MNIFLWVLQVLLAIHTIIGAVWKFSNSEQTIPTLQALPHAVWLSLSGFEILFSVCLLLPALNRRFAALVFLGAAGIAAEMILFTVINLFSGAPDPGQIVYWAIVIALCAFLAYGRRVLKPLAPARAGQ